MRPATTGETSVGEKGSQERAGTSGSATAPQEGARLGGDSAACYSVSLVWRLPWNKQLTCISLTCISMDTTVDLELSLMNNLNLG